MRLKELISELNKERPSIEIRDDLVKKLWTNIAENLLIKEPKTTVAMILMDKDEIYSTLSPSEIVKYVRKVGKYYFVVLNESQRDKFESKHLNLRIELDDYGDWYLYKDKE